ncbi:glycosyltransferase [Agarivorans sp. Z349TD_8]|uniref:glycosyltransferase n=1 Tax=Agarivorans sp. Z349TD_8 TaxID=3421434 RepID=UPI003D7EBE06
MILSVVVPTYGNFSSVQKFCFELNQSDFDSVEVVVVDGACCPEMLMLADVFSNVSVVSEEDRGIYDAMNKGIERARGDWITFFGDDDRFFSHHLLNSIFERNLDGYDLVLGDAVYDNGRYFSSCFNHRMLFKHTLCHQSVLYRRTVFETLRYSLDYRLAGDYHLNLRLLKLKANALYLKEPFSICGSDGLSSKGLYVGYFEEYSAVKTIYGWPASMVALLSGTMRFLIKKIRSLLRFKGHG